ncbi:MAG: hypothetical protein HY673_18900 [Chloroflexi bacterium]|nr:hypothetical protein [Chloroflexota bacterium]
MKSYLASLFSFVLLAGVVVACQSQPAATPGSTPAAGRTPSPATPEAKATPTSIPAAKPTSVPGTPAATPPGASPYYQGKTIEMVVASAAGGPSDMHGRALAAFLPQYLPGNPKVIIRNVPGGGGSVAVNSFYNKAKPDGLSLLVSGTSAFTDQKLGLDIVNYDLRKLRFIESLARSGQVLIIRKDALPRLTDLRAPAVVLGCREATEAYQGMTLWGREFLGWNIRWILGFAGVAELELALRRGEVDMMATSTDTLLSRLRAEGVAELIAQLGSLQKDKWVPRSDFPEVPVFGNFLIDKGVKGVPWEAYKSWITPDSALDRWLAAPPGTPDTVASLLVEAIKEMAKNPKFDEMIKKTISPVYTMSYGEDVSDIVKGLLNSPPEVIEYPLQLQRKFGITR